MHRHAQPLIEPLEPRELLALVPQTVTVRVFFDRNSDQRRNRTEAGIPGYRVTAKGLRDDDGTLITSSLISDSKGVARFTTYIDSSATNPPRASISLGADDRYNCLNYPTNSKGTVGGVAAPVIEFAMVDYVIFRGRVTHSFTIADEPFSNGLALRTVFDDANRNGKRDSGETIAQTDLDGEYEMKLQTGRHTLRALPGTDFIAAAGSALTQTFSVNSRPHNAGDPGDFDVVMKAPIVIDVLAAYTQAAAEWLDIGDGIESHIIDMFASANDIYANSNTNVRLNLLGPVEVSFEETGDIDQDLTYLHDAGDGEMDDLRSARTRLRADLVTLIEGPDLGEVGPSSDDDVVGLGYQYQKMPGNDDEIAFSVIRLGTNNDASTLAHELAHNLGAGHDPDNATDEFLTTSYAHGYRFRGNDDKLYKDVMAYGSGTELPFFSTPQFKLAGKPIGNASTADNARVIRQIATEVAGYR